MGSDGDLVRSFVGFLLICLLNMKFVPILYFDNYVPAHIAMGRLKEEGIECWLKDENLVTIDPILTNAVGGIKLMVDEENAKQAFELLSDLKSEYHAKSPCPQCGSTNIELVSTPRKAVNLVSVLVGFFFTNYAITKTDVFHCFNCGHEYKPEN